MDGRVLGGGDPTGTPLLPPAAPSLLPFPHPWENPGGKGMLPGPDPAPSKGASGLHLQGRPPRQGGGTPNTFLRG